MAIPGLVVLAGALWQAAPLEALPLRAEHAIVVGEALRLREAVGDAVWPGFAGVECPIVLQVEEREYLIGFPAAVEGFARVETPEALGELVVQVGPRSNETNLIASFWAHGSPAVVIAAPEALRLGPTEWTLKAAHEMFHVMQSRRGEHEKVASLEIGPADDASWQLDFPFPYADETVQRLIHLQAWPCYVGAREEDDAEARYAAGVALEAAAAMARYLEASGAPERSAEYAGFQAWKEGVALWVEREVARAAAEGGYEPGAAFAALEGYLPFEEVWQQRYSSSAFLAKHAGRAAQSRTMFYHLGLAKAMLLERLDPGWKDRYFEPGVWLDDLLRSAAAAAGPGEPPAAPVPAAAPGAPEADVGPGAAEAAGDGNLPQAASVPFHYIDGLIFVEAMINDAEPALFLLDTGANAPALDDDLAARLALRSAGRTTVLGTAGERDVDTAPIGKLSLGGRELHDLRATVYDLSGSMAPEGRSLGGIIGFDLLNRFAAEIDFDARRLRLVESPVAGQAFIPLDIESGIPRIGATLDGWYSAELRLDTGASLRRSEAIFINLLDRDYEALRTRNPAIEPAGTATATGVGGEVQLRLYRIRSFAVGGRSFDSATIIVQPAAGYFALPEAVGFVSNNLLEKFGRVTIDYAGRRIWLGAGAAAGGTVRQYGAMREALREGKSEGRVGLASVVERPHAFAVGALAGLAGEITIVDGAVWTARVVDGAPIVSGPGAAAEDQATLLTVAHVEAWQEFEVEAGLSGANLEAFIARAAAEAGIDTSQPFAFMLEGTAAEVAMHIIAGACPIASAAPDAAEPWRWASDDADVTIVGFFASGKHGVMTHHGTSVHAHVIATIEGRRVTGHIDRVATGGGMTLRLPAR